MSLLSFANKLAARKVEMQEHVFLFPPKTWDDFQKRLGQYEELSASLTEVNTLIKGEEDLL